MIVSKPRELLWAWMNDRIGIPWSSDFRAIGLVRNDCLVACFGYNGFTGRMCFMHSAIDDPSAITRTLVRAIFEYPFQQLGLVQILAPVPSDNERALEVDRRVGFTDLVTLPGAALGGKDLIILSMRDYECKWIKGKSNGQEERATGSGLRGSSGAAGAVQQGSHQYADVGEPTHAEYPVGKPDLASIPHD